MASGTLSSTQDDRNTVAPMLRKITESSAAPRWSSTLSTDSVMSDLSDTYSLGNRLTRDHPGPALGLLMKPVTHKSVRVWLRSCAALYVISILAPWGEHYNTWGMWFRIGILLLVCLGALMGVVISYRGR